MSPQELVPGVFSAGTTQCETFINGFQMSFQLPFSLDFRTILKLNITKQTAGKIDHINTNKTPNRHQTARPLKFQAWPGEQDSKFRDNNEEKATHSNFEENLM